MDQRQDMNWWGRNWKWFVPVGGLGALVLFTGAIALFAYLVFGLMKSSDVYKMAIAKAKAHPSVQEAIGAPIEAGLLISGEISQGGSSGHADLSIPVSGPDGEATIYILADKSAGQWKFTTLVMEINETRERIDLLE